MYGEEEEDECSCFCFCVVTELTEENADTDDAKARMQDNPMKNLILLTTVRVYQEKNWRGGRVKVLPLEL